MNDGRALQARAQNIIGTNFRMAVGQWGRSSGDLGRFRDLYRCFWREAPSTGKYRDIPAAAHRAEPCPLLRQGWTTSGSRISFTHQSRPNLRPVQNEDSPASVEIHHP